MRYARRVALLVALAGTAGCSSHLLFVEHSHVGLKASFEPSQPTPAEVDLGYRRAMFAMIPQKSREPSNDAGSVVVNRDDGQVAITIVPDPNELMSIYTVFKANVGFNDPVCLHHFLATGVAASHLLANAGDLRNLAQTLEGGRDGSPCRSTPQEEPTK
jgi:hypothetical protein